MNFANPLLAFGALAALLPVLIHLFDRRKPRVQAFGPIAFVLRSQARTAARLRLKRLLLYALRTLLLLALPLALARPSWNEAAALTSSAGPAATAIVIDASLSMRWRDGDSSFEKALVEARRALQSLSPQEPATLVRCTVSPDAVAPPSFDKARLLDTLSAFTPSAAPSLLNPCLDAAAKALEDSPLAAKRLVVISDFTARALSLEGKAPTVKGPTGEPVQPEVVIYDVGKQALPNRAVVDLKVTASPSGTWGTQAFTATVVNHSLDAARDVEVQLRVDGAVVTKGFIDVAAGASALKTLQAKLPPGKLSAVSVTLSPDALLEDDARPSWVWGPRPLRALVVNGAPHAQKLRDEAFFLEAALSHASSPVRPTLRDASAAWREDFSAYDVVWLLNCEAPPEDVAKRLEAYVQGGGGLFIAAGDNVDVDAWNARLPGVLPRALRMLKTAVEPGSADASSKAARLTQSLDTHPVMAPFSGRAREGLFSTRVMRYLLLEAGQGDVLLSLDDGAPLLVADRRGKGRVLLFASTFDRDWGDFAIRTSFVPLAQRAAAWLAGALEERDEVVAQVETKGQWPVTDVPVARVEGPDGKSVAIEREADGSGRTQGVLPLPGHYRALSADGQPVAAASWVAVVDSSEADLTRADLDAVRAWFGEGSVRQGGESDAEHSTPLWTWLLLAAAVAFILEGAVLRL